MLQSRSTAPQKQHQSTRFGHCNWHAVNAQEVYFHASRTQGTASSANPTGHSSRFGRGHSTSTSFEARSWLALRASVLRRAVSQSARPFRTLHLHGQRGPLFFLRTAIRKGQCSSAAPYFNPVVAQLHNSSFASAVQPNHSLNRTHCGGPSFGL